MTAFTEHTDVALAINRPWSSQKAKEQRDNLKAFAEGNAPAGYEIQTAALGDGIVTTAKLSGGEQMTTTNVNGAIAGSSVGGIGTYAFLTGRQGGGTYNPGDTLSGSVMRYAGVQIEDVVTDGAIFGAEYGSGPPGTWRCMGYAAYTGTGPKYGTTLWLRIS